MSNEITKKNEEFALIEQVVMQGDLSKLTPQQRVMYHNRVCESAGLNPLTNPFAYILLNGKLTLYAKKDCTEQLRKINGVSIEGLEERIIDDIFMIKARARDKNGRTDESTGAVVIGHLKGEAKANAIMKAETKAKRRVTLSICGMGWVDESEVDSIPNAKQITVDMSTGELKDDLIVVPQETPVLSLEERPKFTEEQIHTLQNVLNKCSPEYKKWFYERIQKQYKAESLADLPSDLFKVMMSTSLDKAEEFKKTQSISVDPFEVLE